MKKALTMASGLGAIKKLADKKKLPIQQVKQAAENNELPVQVVAGAVANQAENNVDTITSQVKKNKKKITDVAENAPGTTLLG